MELRKQVVYEKPDQVEARLHGLSLWPALFEKVVGVMESERRTCTANDPRMLKGIVPWGRGIRALREELIRPPHNWHREEPLGLPLVVDSKRRMAVTVETGDSFTGQNGPSPRTKHPKGSALADYITGSPQLAFLPEDEKPDLWILLVARTDDEIRAELSRPSSISGFDGRVHFQSERILLRPTPLHSELMRDEEIEDDGIEVVIERK